MALPLPTFSLALVFIQTTENPCYIHTVYVFEGTTFKIVTKTGTATLSNYCRVWYALPLAPEERLPNPARMSTTMSYLGR